MAFGRVKYPMKFKKLSIFCAFIIILSLLVYLIIFHHGLSSNSSDWGNFGGYVGGVSALALSTLATYWSWYSFKKDNENKINQSIIDQISLSVARLDELRFAIEELTKYNGFDSAKKKRLERSLLNECELIIAYCSNVKLEAVHDLTTSVNTFITNTNDDNYNLIVSAFSTFVSESVNKQLKGE